MRSASPGPVLQGRGDVVKTVAAGSGNSQAIITELGSADGHSGKSITTSSAQQFQIDDCLSGGRVASGHFT
jgi:hypothetical protein